MHCRVSRYEEHSCDNYWWQTRVNQLFVGLLKRCLALSKVFLFLKKTFWHILSCLAKESGLKFRKHDWHCLRSAGSSEGNGAISGCYSSRSGWRGRCTGFVWWFGLGLNAGGWKIDAASIYCFKGAVTTIEGCRLVSCTSSCSYSILLIAVSISSEKYFYGL